MKTVLRTDLNNMLSNESVMGRLLKGLPLDGEGTLVINSALIRLRNNYQIYIHRLDPKVTKNILGGLIANYLRIDCIKENCEVSVNEIKTNWLDNIESV
jgi:hypothetical protein